MSVCLLTLGILKDLQSEKLFVKYLSLMMDVTKVPSTLSKTFQSAELCITDILTSLERKDPSTRSSKKSTVKKQVFFRRSH